MNRLEYIRAEIDCLLNSLQDSEQRKFAYLHLYSVSQCATLLALKRKEDVELCSIAAMLHDIAIYCDNCPHREHAQKSSLRAKTMIDESKLFDEREAQLIIHAIAHHSDKMNKEDGNFAELLKDADVLAHYLYNIAIPVSEKDKVRLYYILEEIHVSK